MVLTSHAGDRKSVDWSIPFSGHSHSASPSARETGGGNLAHTGSGPVLPLAIGGAAVIAAGGAIVVAARRKARRA
ncbi:LPXTG cell wall anchor domain-containing protein [Kitasatospora sp. NPDC085464]|uniref:LPXTG cell wall anchor domain-containing protein n=1 Tax=Kitasatospora sp. NPDC085464 TaxID=3364063 RepID=UPI0037C7283A